MKNAALSLFGIITVSIRLCIVSWLLICLLAKLASAQALLNPNQINGTIQFSNSNPAILQVLHPDGGAEGFKYVFVRADSIGITPTLNHVGYYTKPDSYASTSYELTVESSEAGIKYDLTPGAYLDNLGEYYFFSHVTSGLVYPEPAQDVEVNVSECAAMLDIRWVTTDGQPVAVNGGWIGAYRETIPGSGNFNWAQAYDFSIDSGSHVEYLMVRGDGAPYKVKISYNSGADSYLDKLTFLCEKSVSPKCDEVVTITCEHPYGTPDKVLGSIAGKIDMVGKDEHAILKFTKVHAFDGPLGNERFATLNVTPSQGEFSLINLVPSDAAYPNKAYSMRGEMIFGTGYRAQYFLTPTVGIINPGVLVAAGQTTDIGEKLVITPGYVKGAITLTGPKPELGSFLLRGLARDADNDSDGNGIADNPRVELSGVWANGSYKKVVGASTASIGGSARTSFDGSLDLSSNVFSGNYEMALGGLNQEATIWQANELVLQFRENTALTSQTPYQFSALYIINDLLPELEIVPGETVVANHDYCFSAVKVHYRALSGNIWGPRAEIKGGFEGLDYKGKPAKYHLQYGMATGTPAYSNQGSGSTGEVVMSLPEGKYVLTPTVFTNNPSGGYSNTELPAIELDVGCGQVISLTTELQINLGFLPKETNDETITLYGSVTSDKNVTQLSYSLGNSNPIAICTNCGEDPSFSTEIKLQPGENKMLVTAVDEIGNTSTVTAFVYYRPLLEIFGCEDINVETDQPNADVAVDFDVSVGGGSGEGLDIECSYLSGSAFPMGSTTVSCIGKDSLNTTADCSFIVNVVYNEPDAEQPPVDPGCDSLTENCDPDDDPAEPSDPGSGDDSEDICQNNKIVLCHIPPGQPENEQTLSVAFSAVKAHLGHGDVLGSCEALVGKSTLNQEKSGGNDKEDGVCAGDKILVCHIPPGNSEKAHNIYIPIVALPAHFEHGDEIGQCPAAKKDGSDEKNDLAKDSDNDGVTDGQEIADGTDPNDRGSFVSYLNSPVYTLYNSALNMLNVLELVNPLAADTEVKVSLFAINGDLLYARVVTIPKENEVDLILNDMPGFKTSPYGLVKMEFAGIIDGRVYYYRPSAMGSFEYAFNVPFSNVARGVTSVGFNTFQPSSNPTEHENAVLNWLSLVNLADKPKKFTVRTYNQSGEQMSNRHVVVPALGRADIDGGHASLGSSVVGLHEIIPTDNDSPYIGQLIRYGSNAPVGQAATAFDFAFALEAKAGNGREMNIPISHKFNEDNWIELINVLDHPTKVLVRFFNADGVELWSSEVELAGHAQQHLAAFGDGLLARGETGVAVIQPTAPNSIIAQGMYYFRREADGSIAAMYGSQAREAHARPLFGSYNLFLGMENWLKITNTGEEEGEVNVTLRHLDSSDDFVLHVPPHGSALLPLHEYATYGTKADSYGLALVNGENTAKILSELLRVRYVGDTLDFASATPVR